MIHTGAGQGIELVNTEPVSESDKKHMAHVMVSFANTNDGTILVGVDKMTKNIIGLGDHEHFVHLITEINKTYCNPLVLFEAEVGYLAESVVGIVRVSHGSERPYYAQGDCYVRRGREAHIASHSEVQSLYQKHTIFKKEKGDGWPVEAATYQDLDTNKIENYVAKRNEKFGHNFEGTREKLLKDIGILVDVQGSLVPSAGGILMFGRSPQHFLVSSGVRMAKFQGKTTGNLIIDQKEARGTIPEMIEDAARFVIKHISAGAKIEGLQHDDIMEYPLVAVREAITNAIVHRDYAIDGSQVRIFLFDDRIEIYTPGGLATGVTVENIEYTQHSRNRIIAEALLCTGGYIEKLGTGIRRIKLVLKQAGLRDARLFDTGADFVLILFGPLDKTWQVKQQERVNRLQDLSGPAKTPQEIGPLAKERSYKLFSQHGHRASSAPVGEKMVQLAKRMLKLRKIFMTAVAVFIVFILFIGVLYVRIKRRKDPVFQYEKAATWHNRKEYRRAIGAYANFIDKFPDSDKAADAQYYIAGCLEFIGEEINALNAYDELVRRYPNSRWVIYAYYWRAAIYARLGEYEKAQGEYQRILQEYTNHPLTPFVMRELAMMYQKQSKWKEAIGLYDKILDMRGFSSDGYEHYQMGLCYIELGQKDKARQMFQRVVVNEKANPDIVKEAKGQIEKLSR